MHRHIDINSDVGERPEALRDGSEEQLIRELSSANIACGAHAGNEETIRAIVRICCRYDVAVGAHPSYPDRENFGRREMQISPDELAECIFRQLTLVAGVADSEGTMLTHVKPHGALYNCAARQPELAATIGTAVHRIDPRLVLVGLAGSGMLDVWRAQGLMVAAEAFADRRYESDGSLRSRVHADALITSSAEAAGQALSIVTEGLVTSVTGRRISLDAQTICVHSDTPGALQIVLAIRTAFQRAGVALSRFGNP